MYVHLYGHRLIFDILQDQTSSTTHNIDTQTPFLKHYHLQIKVFVAMYYSTKYGFV